MISERVLQALVVTGEVCGANLSEAAVEIMLHDLAEYPERTVLAALADCRKTLTGRFSMAAIIERIKAQDGRPGAEEAWAMLPKGEDESVAWTDEMRFAWGVAYPLLKEGDKIGARMAFKEAYTRRLAESRAAGTPANWEVSLGRDPQLREVALQRAVTAGYIGQEHAVKFLSHSGDAGAVGALLLGDARPLLAAQESTQARETALRNLSRLKEVMKGKPALRSIPTAKRSAAA